MTTQEIIENNKLIAEFMNLNIGEYTSYDEESVKRYTIYDLQYNTSWDWLMPVAHKIISEQFYDECKLNNFDLWIEVNPNLMDNIIDGFKSSINDLYLAIIEFINWYNENK